VSADRSFLSNFAKKPFTVNEQIKLIHDFLDVRRMLAVREPADNSSSRARWRCASRGSRSPQQSLTTPWKRWRSWS